MRSYQNMWPNMVKGINGTVDEKQKNNKDYEIVCCKTISLK